MPPRNDGYNPGHYDPDEDEDLDGSDACDYDPDEDNDCPFCEGSGCHECDGTGEYE